MIKHYSYNKILKNTLVLLLLICLPIKVNSENLLPNNNSGKNVTKKDSLKIITLKDSIISVQDSTANIFKKYPESIDSIYSPFDIFQFNIYKSDAIGLPSILKFHPLIIPLSTTLSSKKNSFSYLGLPAELTSMVQNNNIIKESISNNISHNSLLSSEITSANILNPNIFNYKTYPQQIPLPQTLMLWETGIFGENSLNVRFSRPINKNVSVGIFSTYRSFDRKDYTHSSGDMYNFYKNIYIGLGIDSTKIANAGTNPLTREQHSKISLVFNKNNTILRASYKYTDTHNDIPSEYSDSQTVKIGWEENSQYNHVINVQLNQKVSENFDIIANAKLKNEADKLSPLIKYNYDKEVQHGKYLDANGMLDGRLSLGNNIIELISNTTRTQTTKYNNSDHVVHNIRTKIKYQHKLDIGKTNALLSGEVGQVTINYNDSLENAIIWNLDLLLTVALQKIVFFAHNDYLTPNILYDTTDIISRGMVLNKNHYRLFGVTGKFGIKKIGIILNYTLIDLLNKDVLETLTPVKLNDKTTHTFSIVPTLGRWHGLGASSAWIFSDAKPFIKTHTCFSYYPPKKRHRPRLFIDLVLEHWSAKEPLNWGGISDWSNQFYDLYFKTAVQIQKFRLFYKIDNVFNQRVTYVPGYMMPGLTFRWGFNWVISK